MKSEHNNRKNAEAPRLSRDDWLDAAFQAVVEGGFDNARVLLIAGRLGVTRGSFYWHFRDHADLIRALLTRWHEREKRENQRLQEEALDDPVADLEKLLEVALAHAGADLEYLRFELALGALGRRDTEVAQMLQDVDQMRLALFAKKFERLTGNAKKAAELAALFYLAIVGSSQALCRPIPAPNAKQFMSRIISDYLIRQQSPAVKSAPLP